MHDFAEKIREKGWKISKDPSADGNCGFSALSDQLSTLEPAKLIDHRELREKVVEYMDHLPEETKLEMTSFLTETLQSYLESMKKDGTYVDHVCLQSVSSMLQRDILIVHADHEDVTIQPKTKAATEVLVIGYLPTIRHYVSLKPILDRYEVEDFVAVRLDGKTTKKMFIAKILDTDGDMQLRFLKPTAAEDIFTWPARDDISWNPVTDLIQKLSTSELLPGRGLKLKFKQDELEKCRKKL